MSSCSSRLFILHHQSCCGCRDLVRSSDGPTIVYAELLQGFFVFLMKRYISAIAKKFPRLASLVRKVYYYWLPEIEADLIGALSYRLEKEGQGNKPFYFVQVGAHDGSHDDPIVSLRNRYRQWRGILLEPQEKVYNRLLTNLFNPERFIVLNQALGESDGNQTLYKISFSQKDWATGLASFNKTSIIRSIENGYVERMAKVNGDKLPSDIRDYIEEDNVQTISFKSLVALFEKEPDCIIVDTEGYDFVIVNRLLDFDIRPAIWWFEYSYMDIAELERIIKRLRGMDYLVRRSQWDIFAYQKEN